MKKVIFDAKDDEISVSNIDTEKPIFAKNEEGKLCGMLVNEREKGWILRTGGRLGSAGYSGTAEECMRESLSYYTFYVEIFI